jgi:hypothetical protein
MSTPTTRPNDATATVYPIGGGGAKVWLWIISGVGLVAISVIGFILAIVGQVGQFQLQAMTTLPMIGAVASFAKAWTLRQLPTQISVGANGITLHGRDTLQHYPWERVSWASIDKSPVGQVRRLNLFDERGAKIAAVVDSFPEFDEVAESIKAEVARRYGENSEAIRMRKARRSAVIITVISLLLLVVVFANIWIAYDTQRTNQLLATSSVRGEAKVLRRFIAPNGITRRLEYEVTGDNQQTGKRNVEVTPKFWDAMDSVEKVAVMYVPSEPEISRLVEGEVANTDMSQNPKAMYALSGVLGVLCLLFLGAAVMQWKGWDLDFDSKTRKFSIKPFGTGK